jgi:hypothetical protein
MDRKMVELSYPPILSQSSISFFSSDEQFTFGWS